MTRDDAGNWYRAAHDTLLRRYGDRSFLLDAAFHFWAAAEELGDTDAETGALWVATADRLFARYDTFIGAAHAEIADAVRCRRRSAGPVSPREGESHGES